MVSVTPPSDPVPSTKLEIPQKSRNRNTQLPSPVSPSTQPSPCSPSSSISSPAATIQTTPQYAAVTPSSRSHIVPIKGFVHEVLRRSRTSGGVLQTALCYLEAIRSKVPELLRKESMGEGLNEEIASDCRIVRGANLQLDLDPEADLDMTLDSIINTENCADDGMDTVRVSDGTSQGTATLSDTSVLQEDGTLSPGLTRKAKSPSPPLPPLPPLPSPLLCPRRAFLASLILASKFTQDKCYSNRAWAKLAGLPPREIGRCERALGEALEWRLWVGKAPCAPPPPSASLPVSVKRPVVRSRSESALLVSTSSRSQFLVQRESPSTTTMSSPSSLQSSFPSSMDAVNRGLRRWQTLPNEAFVLVQIPMLVEGGRGTRRSSDGDTSASQTGEGHNMQFCTIAHQDQHMSSPNSFHSYVTHDVKVFISHIHSGSWLIVCHSSTEVISRRNFLRMPCLLQCHTAGT